MNTPLKMSVPHVYAWAKRRGFFGRTGDLSHLLLDKGVLCIPESANQEFVHEYAKGVLTKGRPPCIVEYKLKTFRMFYDLDIFTTSEMAKKMTEGVFSEDVRRFFYLVCETTAMLFDVSKTTVTMCISNMSKKKGDGFKVGVHLTFDNIFVTSPTALYIREKVLEKLVCEENPFSNTWDSIVDSSVFKGSGMRLPWSAKNDDLKRFYVPMMEYVLDSNESGIVEHKLEPEVICKSVSAIRDLLIKVCLRTRGSLTKLRNPEVNIEDASPSHSGSFSHPSLKQFSGVVEEMAKYIPDVYTGKVTGVIRTEFVYMFRHSSRYCANVEREHHSSNTYFLVTKSGMRQCCYSRKEEDIGRKYCLCSQFRGDLIKLPKKMMDELFPEELEEKKNLPPPPTPSSSMRNFLDIDRIVERANKKTTVKRNVQPKKQAVYHPGKAVMDVFK